MNNFATVVTMMLGVSLLNSGATLVRADDAPEDRVSVKPRVVEERIETEEVQLRVVQLVHDLHHPWGVTWLPDGRVVITERPGNMLLIDLEEETVTSLNGLPPIKSEEDQKTAPEGGQQGGLLDVAAHPDVASNGWIYFTYSSPGDDDAYPDEEYTTGTALGRARLSDDSSELIDRETLYAQSPRHRPGRHYGSRIVFPGDGSVIFSIGDRGLRWPSQDLTDPGGSMIRLNEDGGVYPGNPFIGMPPGNLRPEIHSFGHRNNQAMVLHPESGELWTAEHGPRGGDLLHVVEAGRNYGWPVVAAAGDYSTNEMIGVGRTAPGIESPVHIWEQAIAPSGMAYYDGERFSQWRGNLFVGSLVQQQLHRLVLNGRDIAHEEVLLNETIGRVRDVQQGPDGLLYLLTDESDGGLYRLEPVQ